MVSSEKFIVGRQLLDIITSGMYDNPMMVYREYVQNAVDSIDEYVANGGQPADCEIRIDIDGLSRKVVVEDTGAGLPEEKAEKILLSLGFSPKEEGGFRGFRGIGRLGGLGYCDALKFETRSSATDRVTEVVWSRSRLDRLIESENRVSLEDALSKIVETSVKDATESDPERFFRVTLENVRQFHSDQLMQVTKVRSYLAEVAPVPFSEDFTMGQKIEKHLSAFPGYKTYLVYVNDQKINRCYEDIIEFSERRTDVIEEIQEIKVSGANNEVIAKGWVAKLKYFGSLPAQNRMRGIRIRQGNIEVGGEYCLAEHYSEARFATWQVGEIHVAMNSIKANARRDGFENSPNYERLLEYCTKLGKHLSKACRQESRIRNNQAKAINGIERVKNNLHKNAVYIDEDHFNDAKNSFLSDLSMIKADVEKYGLSSELLIEIKKLEEAIGCGEIKVNLLVDMVNFTRFNNKSGKKAFIEFVKSVVKNKGKGTEVDTALMKSLSVYFKSDVSTSDELSFSSAGM